eukprot:TRINITY_DN64285_c0_g1_i1.p1 TRINITY_DN64285_c0_g1~~TRINITY_DN64285_c0_g1_i1.p1  ORF type:complete len:404 (+),score=69.88 TRINITY_DN64285_c0_g1_i1:57-1268(+)
MIKASASLEALSTGNRERRIALILANGKYTQRAPLSKISAAADDLCTKLSLAGFEVTRGDDLSLEAMRALTKQWLQSVELVAQEVFSQEQEASCIAQPPLIFFTFCGHGRSGRFVPIDCARGAPDEAMYCFFEDFLYRLYEALGAGEGFWKPKPSWIKPERDIFGNLVETKAEPVQWQPPNARVICLIESCRRLSPEEQKAFDAQRARIAHGKRHILPCMVAMRPDLANLGGAEWDASRLAFLSQLGAGAPRLLLALSSESTTPSYDVVFLRSFTEGLDKPVKLGGILERAALDTLRRTGHKQRPVLLNLDGGDGNPLTMPLHDIVLAPAACPAMPPRRCNSVPSAANLCSNAVAPSGYPSGRRPPRSRPPPDARQRSSSGRPMARERVQLPALATGGRPPSQ